MQVNMNQCNYIESNAGLKYKIKGLDFRQDLIELFFKFMTLNITLLTTHGL